MGIQIIVGKLKFVGTAVCNGKVMVEGTAKLDAKGRIRIPRKIREAAQLAEGSCVNIKAEGKTILIEASEPIADKYYGIVQVDQWPEDLDEYAKVEMQKRWKKRVTM